MKRRLHTAPVSRKAFVLAVVTITIVLLSLAAYNYSGTMLTEHEAAMMGGRDVVARTAAESAIEYAATRIMEKDADETVDLYHDPDGFQAQILIEAASPRLQVRYSVLTPDETNSGAGAIRFGVGTENSRFNVNKLLELDQAEENLPEEERVGLASLAASSIPNMTDEVIESILDWLDTDDEARPYGAESSYYETLNVPYECKNGPMDSIDELLKVQGVTPELFYGEDDNQNGLLDPDEDDNEDGILTLGWKHYLTASSRERNTTPDGQKKINLNMGEMTELYDSVEELYGEEAASFIVAARLAGTDYLIPGQPETQSGIQDQISRNDIDLTVVPIYRFNSLFDLIGGETSPTKMISGIDQSFNSPWTNDASTLLNTFPDLEQNLTVTDDAFIEGRVNINEARWEVLQAVMSIPPDVPANVADSVIASRPPVDVQGASANVMARRLTAAWILAEGIVDLPTLRQLGPYITTRGDVYRFTTVGHFDDGGPTTRMEAMVDATEFPPRITFVRDLTTLGRGYAPSLLLPQNQ